MFDLQQLLLEEQEKLKRIIGNTKKRLSDAPDGRLRVSRNCGHAQYYHVKIGDRQNGVYIKQENVELARRLAQKEYDQTALNAAEKQLVQIQSLLDHYDFERLTKIYASEHKARQKLITPEIPTYERLAEDWLAVPYKGKGFSEGAPEIFSEKRERVRSKTEKIIADYLLRNGIPYKYECPLALRGFGTIYPDFTLLSRTSGQEIYLEHEGRMDDPEYAEKAVRKIKLYEENGILPGERLILTYETSKTMLNTEILEKLLRQVGVV